MKILHLTNHLNTGGITTYVQTLAGEQVKAGQEVFVWGARGTCSGDLRAEGVTLFEDVPRCKSELSPKLWLALPQLIKILKTRSIDIVHTHTRVTQVLAAVATSFTKVPYVSTAHMFYKRRLGRRLFPCWGKGVIAISKTMAEGLRTIFPEKELPPVVVVPNGIDVEKLQAKFAGVDRDKIREGYGYRKEDLVVLSLCRLIPVKGIHILIEAFAAVHKEIPEVKLLLAGTGDPVYIQGLKDRVAQGHLEGDVLFIGNEPEIEKPLRAGDIFVAPYLWAEAFGLAILEAMAVGLPVAGSITGSIPDLLGHGKYGLLFEKGSIPDLTSCLLRYVKDASLRSEMGKAERHEAREYTAFKMCAHIQNVYENVLKKKA